MLRRLNEARPTRSWSKRTNASVSLLYKGGLTTHGRGVAAAQAAFKRAQQEHLAAGQQLRFANLRQASQAVAASMKK